MPLAGNVKLRNFLAAIVGVVLLGGLALVMGAWTLCSSILTAPEVVPAPDVVPELAPPPPSTEALQPTEASLADPELWVEAVLATRDTTLAGPKAKDVSAGKPYKINLYQDDGRSSVTRAKVDIDRDDKWDEKYSFDGSTVTRQVAPSDDEVYSRVLVLQGETWVAEGEPAPAEASATPAPATDPDRPWDAVLLGWQGRDLGTVKIKDASKTTSWKINLYQDEGQASVSRAKVDIDRDDKWDEKWTFAADGLSREVSPGDDEAYAETWTWSGSAWAQ